MPSRFCGSCVIAGTLLSLILGVALHLLKPDYDPLRSFCSEYLIGPYGFLGTIAAYIIAATFVMLLIGLRLSVQSSGSLTASCILLGVIIVSTCVAALFPIDLMPPDGSHPKFTKSGIIHLASAVPLFFSLIALFFTLPSAYKRDEKWRPLSQKTLLLGIFLLMLFVGLVRVPFYLRGLAQRAMGLPVLIWLLLTGLHLRRAMFMKESCSRSREHPLFRESCRPKRSK